MITTLLRVGLACGMTVLVSAQIPTNEVPATLFPAPGEILPAIAPSETAPTNAPAETLAPAKKKAAPKAKKPAPSVRGTISAIDKVAMTVTVDDPAHKSHLLRITSQTRMTKAGKPATFQEAVIGETVHISYVKAKDGTQKSTWIEYGAPLNSARAKAAKAKKPARKPGGSGDTFGISPASQSPVAEPATNTNSLSIPN